MRHETQIALIERILAQMEDGATARASAPWRNPATDYADADQATLEHDLLFRREPLFLGLSCDAASPGDWFTHEAAGVPILVVRREDGRVNAFVNACRHRASAVAQGKGKGARRFTCPFHGWTYDRDGALVGQPAPEAFAGMADADCALSRLPVAEKYGLIFARPAPGDAVDVSTVLNGMETELEPFGFENYHHFETRRLEKPINWKLVIDTFLEAWHITALHRDSISAFLLGTPAGFDAFGRSSRVIGVRRSMADLRGRPKQEWNLMEHTTLLYCIFPNTVFIYQKDHVEAWQVYPSPEGPGRSIMHVTLYAPEPISNEKAKAYWNKNLDLLIDVTEQEDFAIAAGIQKAASSGAIDHVTFGRNEPGLIHFHQNVRRAIGLYA